MFNIHQPIVLCKQRQKRRNILYTALSNSLAKTPWYSATVAVFLAPKTRWRDFKAQSIIISRELSSMSGSARTKFPWSFTVVVTASSLFTDSMKNVSFNGHRKNCKLGSTSEKDSAFRRLRMSSYFASVNQICFLTLNSRARSMKNGPANMTSIKRHKRS